MTPVLYLISNILSYYQCRMASNIKSADVLRVSKLLKCCYIVENVYIWIVCVTKLYIQYLTTIKMYLVWGSNDILLQTTREWK